MDVKNVTKDSLMLPYKINGIFNDDFEKLYEYDRIKVQNRMSDYILALCDYTFGNYTIAPDKHIENCMRLKRNHYISNNIMRNEYLNLANNIIVMMERNHESYKKEK